jgi:hypothetical protein
MIVVLAGAHTGAVDHAFLNNIPRAASRSTLGVIPFGSP